MLTLMRELKAIGAHNVTNGRARGLTGRRRLAAMTQAYETHAPRRKTAGDLRSDPRDLLGRAARASCKAEFPRETLIAPGAIRRRRQK